MGGNYYKNTIFPHIMSYKEFELTDEHKQIFEELFNGSKRIKIYAGPGTGKTTTLVESVMQILNEKKAYADEILFLTFSRESMQDIKSKFYKKLIDKELSPNEFIDLSIFTFHGFCNYLRKTIYDLDLIDAKLLDEKELFLEAFTLISKVNEDYGDKKTDNEIDKEIIQSWEGEPEADWLNIEASQKCDIETNKEDYIGINEIENELEVTEIINKISIIQENYKSIFNKQNYSEEVEFILGHYLGHYAIKRQNLESLDYGLLLRLVTEKLRKNDDIRKEVAQNFKYIFVDEFQDTNSLQEEFLDLISEFATVIIVGDKNQSIYGFRGSDNSILENKYIEVTPKYLTYNRRSTKNIIDFSNAFFNFDSKGYYVKPIDPNNIGESVILNECESHEQEAENIIKFIYELLKNGYDYSDIAILTSSNKASNKTGELIKRLKQTFKDKLTVVSKGGLFKNEHLNEILKLFQSLNQSEDYNGLLDIDIEKEKIINYLNTSQSILKTYYFILSHSRYFKTTNDEKILIDFATLSTIIDSFEDFEDDIDICID